VTGSYILAAAPAPAVQAQPSLPFRILGVFDGDTGAPIPDVHVVDVATGTFARTTTTGTVSLGFMPAGNWRLNFEKPGYDSLSMPIVISARDTTPVTVVLARRRTP